MSYLTIPAPRPLVYQRVNYAPGMGHLGAEAVPSPQQKRIQEEARRQIEQMLPVIMKAMEQKMSDTLDNLNEDVKDAITKSAAINTGIKIALNFIPIVGTLVSALYSAIMGSLSSRYMAEAQTILNNARIQAKLEEQVWKNKISELKTRIIKEESKPAIKMALESADPTKNKEGVDGLGFWHLAQAWMAQASTAMVAASAQMAAAAQAGAANVAKSAHHTGQEASKSIQAGAQNLAKTAADTHRRLEEELGLREREESGIYDKARSKVQNIAGKLKSMVDVQGAWNLLSGRIVKEQTKAAATQFINEARIKNAANYDAIQKQLNSDAFRQNLRKQLVQQLMQDPTISSMLKKYRALKIQEAKAKAGVLDAAEAVETIQQGKQIAQESQVIAEQSKAQTAARRRAQRKPVPTPVKVGGVAAGALILANLFT